MWVKILLITFSINYFVDCNVINLDRNNFDKLSISNATKFIYGFQVPNGDMGFVKKFLEFETRLQSRLQRFDVTADVFAVNCFYDKIDDICFDNKNEFHVLHGYHDKQNFTQELNPTERISERFIIKQALKFVDPDHIDGCEDVILNSIRFEDPLVQDDEMEVQWYQNRKRSSSCFHCPLDFQNVKILCKKSFDKFLTDNKIAMVLFHLNVDITSRTVLEKFINASTLRSDLAMAAVSCNDWLDVCEQQNVADWPQIWFYKNGQKYKEYTLPFDSMLMANSLGLISQPSVKILENEQDVEEFSRGFSVKLTSKMALPAVTIGFFASKTSDEYVQFSKLAEKLHGDYSLGAVFGVSAESWLKMHKPELNVPTLITFLPVDKIQLAHKSNTFDEENLKKFIKYSSIPSLTELNPISFPSLAFDNDLLVITILPDGKENFFFDTLEKLAKMQNCPKTKFTFLDKSTQPTLTCKLIKSYHLKLTRAPIIIGVTKEAVFVYDKSDEMDFELQTVLDWIMNVKEKKISPSNSLKQMEKHTRPMVFDYLNLISASQMETSQSMKSDSKMDDRKMKMETDNKNMWSQNVNKSQLKHEEL